MTAMFPDSGVPPSDARNSLPDPNTQNCNELWYSTSRCQPRFDPAAANAQLSELINVINQGPVTYDCNKLDQVQLAIKYMIQRGLPKGAEAPGTGAIYTAQMNPTLIGYNDYLTLVIIPLVTNNGAMTLNVDGKGPVPVLRNNNTPMQVGDAKAGIPLIVVYWQGSFYVPYPVESQIPQKMTDTIVTWIRTDGNDLTGDGSANTPDKAFRTINGAWARVADKYIASPRFAVRLILGNPGAYEPGRISGFGGYVTLESLDPASPASYVINCENSSLGSCIAVISSRMTVTGVTLMMNAVANGVGCASAYLDGHLILVGCNCEVSVDNTSAALFKVTNSSSLHLLGSTNIRGYSGFVRQIGYIWSCGMNGNYTGAGTPPNTLYIANLNCVGCCVSVADMSIAAFFGTVVNLSAVTGIKYNVVGNSIYNAYGQATPGNLAGSTGFGGQFIP